MGGRTELTYGKGQNAVLAALNENGGSMLKDELRKLVSVSNGSFNYALKSLHGYGKIDYRPTPGGVVISLKPVDGNAQADQVRSQKSRSLYVYYTRKGKSEGRPVAVMNAETGSFILTDNVVLDNITGSIVFNNAPPSLQVDGPTTILEIPMAGGDVDIE